MTKVRIRLYRGNESRLVTVAVAEPVATVNLSAIRLALAETDAMDDGTAFMKDGAPVPRADEARIMFADVATEAAQQTWWVETGDAPPPKPAPPASETSSKVLINLVRGDSGTMVALELATGSKLSHVRKALIQLGHLSEGDQFLSGSSLVPRTSEAVMEMTDIAPVPENQTAHELRVKGSERIKPGDPKKHDQNVKPPVVDLEPPDVASQITPEKPVHTVTQTVGLQGFDAIGTNGQRQLLRALKLPLALYRSARGEAAVVAESPVSALDGWSPFLPSPTVLRTETSTLSSTQMSDVKAMGVTASASVEVPFVSASASASHDVKSGSAGLVEAYRFVSVIFIRAVELRWTFDHMLPRDEVLRAFNRVMLVPREQQLETLERAFQHHGAYIATQVTLGGSLILQMEKTGSDQKTFEREVNSISANLSAAAGGYGGGIGAGASKGQESSINLKSRSDSLRIEANGGDPALTGDSGQWMASLGTPVNWRVISVDATQPIINLLPEALRMDLFTLIRDDARSASPVLGIDFAFYEARTDIGELQGFA